MKGLQEIRDLDKIATIKELLPIEGKVRIELADFNENLKRLKLKREKEHGKYFE